MDYSLITSIANNLKSYFSLSPAELCCPLAPGEPSKAQPALVNFETLNQIAALAISINFVLLLKEMRTKTPSSRINLRDTWYKSLFPYPPTSATTNFFIFLFSFLSIFLSFYLSIFLFILFSIMSARGY